MIGAYQIIRTGRFREDREGFPAWLASELRDRSIATQRVKTESFGWSLPLRNSPYALRIECGSRNDEQTEWGAYVMADANIFERMFRRVAIRKEIERVTAVLEQVIKAV
jgi:hypothetical protein